MSTQAPPAPSEQGRPDPGIKPQETLSQLIAKILDQLSISAWLPAGALVFIVLFYGALRRNEGHLGTAMQTIGSLSFGSIVLLVGAVVLVTMVIQAFEFEGVRLLEGYWGSSGLVRRLDDVRSDRHVQKQVRLAASVQKIQDRAFASARQQMLKKSEIQDLWINIIEADLNGRAIYAPEEDLAKARALDWNQYAPPEDIRRIDAFVDRLNEYPVAKYRVRATILGNTMRAYEDRAYNPDTGSLPGMVMRVFHRLPLPLQSEHDQYRTRLELYCSMCIVLALAAVTAFPILTPRSGIGWQLPTLVIGVALGLAVLSYRAAIASARGYGTALEEISRYIEDTSTDEEGEATSSA